MRNLAILHRSGKILFSRNYQDEPLERHTVIGFISSLPNLTRSLLHEEVHQVMGKKSRVVLQVSGHYIVMAHVNNSTPFILVANVLSELIGLLQLLFGHPDTWTTENTDFDGCQDIIDMICTQGIHNPCVGLHGVYKAHIKYESQVRLDKLLVYFESIQGICNNASMLVVGDTVILSRFEQEPTRLLLYLHKARPLKHSSVCFTPVFLNSSWFGLLRVQLASYSLLVLSHLDQTDGSEQNSNSISTSPMNLNPLQTLQSETGNKLTTVGSTTTPLRVLLAKISEFQNVFLYTRIELPSEEKPVLIRQYAKRETLLFLHLQVKSGTVTFPMPRPLPEIQMRELYATFWKLFGEAKTAFTVPGTKEVTYMREVYRFHGRVDAEQELYVMMAADAVTMEQITGHVNEILMNMQRQI